MKNSLLIIVLFLGLIGVNHANPVSERFAPQGAEWYFNLSSFMASPIGSYRMAVEGDTLIQGHLCSVITKQFLGGNGDQQFVYENQGVVYWYNQTLQDFTTLYDFNAEAGESWVCYIDSCSYVVSVQSVDEVTWEGHTYRVQVTAPVEGDYYYFAFGRIIEGIGSVDGLFPYPYSCGGGVYDGSYPDYLRCYLVDGEMLYHEGEYDCEQMAYCWDGTVAEAYAGGDGTPENPYKIATSNQLALLAQQTNDGTGGDAYYELTANINLQNCDNGSQQWVSIGTETNMFKGHFNGNGNMILHLNQHVADDTLQTVCGLFGYTDRAEISNVQLLICSISGNGLHVGGLVGYAGMTDISNCGIHQSSIKTTNGLGVAGGLVGSADMPYNLGAYITDIQPYHITNCHVGEATWIEGASGAGGIVGKVNRLDGRNPCMITDCSVDNNGFDHLFTVTSQLYAGGIVGWFSNGTISGCVNQFDVTGGLKYGVGGIVGEADRVNITNCVNEGQVFSKYAGGGIVGLSYSAEEDILEVVNCTNRGIIQVYNTSTSGSFVGGVVGSCGNAAIIGCVNKGDVSIGVNYKAAAGGIVGDSQGLLTNCYNRGTVLATLNASVEQMEELFVGGIIGTDGSTVYNVYNTGVIDVPELPDVITHGYGNILGKGRQDSNYLNAYWLDDDEFSACGMVNDPASHGSSAFIQGATATSWILEDAQYGTNDLLEALNAGADFIFESLQNYPYLYSWEEDTENTNDGLPVLGESVTLVGTKFFDEASGLYYIITSGNTVEVTYDVTHFNTYVGDVVIPETVTYQGKTYTVTAVGDSAFENCEGQLTSVTIPNTVTSIGEKAFASSTHLRIVIIPNSVNTIGDMTFTDCLSLTTVRLPDEITVLPYNMFGRCESLTSLVIPSTVTCIEKYALQGTALTSIEIPESVTYIGEGAFGGCHGLASVTIPNTVSALGSGVFSGCFNLQSVHLPENLGMIPDELFSNCQKLASISIPETVMKIGEGAFYHCYGLTEITIPAAVTTLGTSAFEKCRNLETIHLPEAVNHLGDCLFKDCYNLNTVVLPEGIDTIPNSMFAGCSQLDSIVIPESVVAISGWAFANCCALKGIVIPNNVLSIGVAAFIDCANLSKVELGASVSYLAESVFSRIMGECVKLTLVCHGTNPAVCGYTTFPDEALQKMVITPCGFEDAYREAWGEYWQSGHFEEDCDFVGSEWYYEILNDDGSITYQYLSHESDTTVNSEEVHIIVRINTLYDKGEHWEKSYEYVYEKDDKLYWWNDTLGEFTVLYDYNAQVGDEWEIKVGLQSITMHVDTVELYEYEGRQFKLLQVSDAEDLFSGMIVCGIGHLSSFFPERLMHKGKGYRVEGIRCFWQDGKLLFKYGEKDCDEVYEQYHNDVDESVVPERFKVYPNPTDGLLYVEMQRIASLPQGQQEYRIINMMGQTLMTGRIENEIQQIDVSALLQGMYFINIGSAVQKLMICK